MARLMSYFRKTHQVIISEKMAQRLAHTVRNMTQVDAGILLGVMGSDASALLPRRVDVSLGELRAALGGRRVSA
jgi:actin-like ATPase involved in cell morphogenesis